MNILLIAGGWSSERDVALSGGKGLIKALNNLGHNTTHYDPADSLDDLPAAVAGQDFVFINLHGSPGEDGLIQSMLEQLDVPYQGASAAGSMLALNKAAAKALFQRAGLNTAPWKLLTKKPSPPYDFGLPYPLFIKCNTGGSSLHMERVDDSAALPAALDRLFALHSDFLVEPAVNGAEITCGVLGKLEGGREVPVALPPILIKPKASSGVFDYTSKYTPGQAEEICPAPIPEALTRQIQDMTLRAHRAIGLEGYSRADFIVPEGKEPVLLEINTLPGMTPTSLIPQEAAAIGLTFEDLVQRLVDLGLARHRARRG